MNRQHLRSQEKVGILNCEKVGKNPLTLYFAWAQIFLQLFRLSGHGGGDREICLYCRAYRAVLVTDYPGLPQRCLYFFPLPQGQESFRSGLRLVYAWFPEERRMVFIELYHKNDKENENRQRILDNFGS